MSDCYFIAISANQGNEIRKTAKNASVKYRVIQKEVYTLKILFYKNY
jgi:hypothetical protein